MFNFRISRLESRNFCLGGKWDKQDSGPKKELETGCYPTNLPDSPNWTSMQMDQPESGAISKFVKLFNYYNI